VRHRARARVTETFAKRLRERECGGESVRVCVKERVRQSASARSTGTFAERVRERECVSESVRVCVKERVRQSASARATAASADNPVPSPEAGLFVPRRAEQRAATKPNHSTLEKCVS
jgi:hypothetical protein